MEEEEDHEDTSGQEEEERGTLMNCCGCGGIVGEGCGQCSDGAEGGGGEPDDKPGENSADTKYGNDIPQVRNQRRAHAFMVDKISALMIALSMLATVSNATRPITTNTAYAISMLTEDMLGLIGY